MVSTALPGVTVKPIVAAYSEAFRKLRSTFKYIGPRSNSSLIDDDKSDDGNSDDGNSGDAFDDAQDIEIFDNASQLQNVTDEALAKPDTLSMAQASWPIFFRIDNAS